jgi:hypothetical protein
MLVNYTLKQALVDTAGQNNKPCEPSMFVDIAQKLADSYKDGFVCVHFPGSCAV